MKWEICRHDILIMIKSKAAPSVSRLVWTVTRSDGQGERAASGGDRRARANSALPRGRHGDTHQLSSSGGTGTKRASAGVRGASLFLWTSFPTLSTLFFFCVCVFFVSCVCGFFGVIFLVEAWRILRRLVKLCLVHFLLYGNGYQLMNTILNRVASWFLAFLNSTQFYLPTQAIE